MSATSLYQKLDALTKKYFPLDCRYLHDELITYHLKINPKNIKLNGLQGIVSWLSMAANFAIKDPKDASKFINKLRKLAELN